MSALYVIAAIGIGVGVISVIEAFKTAGYMHSYGTARSRTYSPSVTIICPCRGIDAELEKNIQSILDQDYPNFRAVFVVGSADDPAYDFVRALGMRDVLVAGACVETGQKVHNLMHAVRMTSHDADVLVFCDSDARFPRSWLSELIAPLRDHNIGVTTGYRWYAVTEFNVPTLVLSAWNASTLSVLGNHNRNFVWGGSMAVRRETFERLNVLDGWKGAVSDDHAMRRIVSQAGLRIVFVPPCVVPSFGRSTWREMLEFTTRQVTITRVYHPSLWWLGMTIHSISNLALLSAALLAILSPGAMTLSLFPLIYLLTAYKSWIIVRGSRAVLPVSTFFKHTWFYAATGPLVGLLYQYNLIRSLLSRDILWRGIRYTLISSNETRVGQYGESGN